MVKSVPTQVVDRAPARVKGAVSWAKGAAGLAAAASLAVAYLKDASPEALLIAGGTIVGMVFLTMLVILLSGFQDDGEPLPARRGRDSSRQGRQLDHPGGADRRRTHLPVIVLVWGSVAIALTVAVILVGSAVLLLRERFFPGEATPDPPSIVLPAGETPPSGIPEQQHAPTKSQLRPEMVPRMLLDTISPPLFAASPQDALREELRARSSLVLDGTVLKLEPPTQKNDVYYISVFSLTFKNGARIVTNGRHVVIKTTRLIVEQGSIASFESVPGEAEQGKIGTLGLDGGRIEVTVLDRYDGILTIALRGQTGGKGGAGAPGEKGAKGSHGANAVSAGAFCRSGGQDGGGGGQGGDGANGAKGGSGGRGGTIRLVGVVARQSDRLFTEGGKGGEGGTGGARGAGGDGGDAGSGDGPCGGGRRGPDGPPGRAGNTGEPGANGVVGSIERRERMS